MPREAHGLKNIWVGLEGKSLETGSYANPDSDPKAGPDFEVSFWTRCLSKQI